MLKGMDIVQVPNTKDRAQEWLPALHRVLSLGACALGSSNFAPARVFSSKTYT